MEQQWKRTDVELPLPNQLIVWIEGDQRPQFFWVERLVGREIIAREVATMMSTDRRLRDGIWCSITPQLLSP